MWKVRNQVLFDENIDLEKEFKNQPKILSAQQCKLDPLAQREKERRAKVEKDGTQNSKDKLQCDECEQQWWQKSTI